ncbi:hypothetical protein HPB47_011230, partial [Ixodes persulcatus]
KTQQAAQGEKMQRQLHYRRNLIEQIVGHQRVKPKRRGAVTQSDMGERLDGKQHFLYKLDKRSSNDCAVCSNRKTKGGRRETVFFYKTCNNGP